MGREKNRGKVLECETCQVFWGSVWGLDLPCEGPTYDVFSQSTARVKDLHLTYDMRSESQCSVNYHFCITAVLHRRKNRELEFKSLVFT